MDSLRPGRGFHVALDGAGERPGPELGAYPVHGAVRPGDAAAARRLHAAGEPCWVRGDGAVLRRRRAVRRGLAGRRYCGMAAVAPGLHRVLQAAGLHAGPAPGAHGRTRPASIVQGTVASGVSRVDLRAWAWPGVRRADRPSVSGGADAGPGAAQRRHLIKITARSAARWLGQPLRAVSVSLTSLPRAGPRARSGTLRLYAVVSPARFSTSLL